MKIIKQTGNVLISLGLALLALVGIGSLYPIPYFGSIGGAIVLTAPHLVLPLFCLLFILILYLFIKKRASRLLVINLIFISIAFITSSLSFAMMKGALTKSGAQTSLVKSYQLEDVSQVQTDTQTYTTSEFGDVELNIYRMEDGKTDKPVILYIHGGGWISGDKENRTYSSKVFAKNGYVSVSLDYDLSDTNRHLYASTEQQLTLAVAWIEANIENYGGSTKHLFLTGDSAGGNLALEIAYKINSGIYVGVDGRELPKIRAVSTLYPVSSPKSFYENDDLVMGNMAKNMVLSYLGQTPEDNPSIYNDITPINFISDNTPPTLFISGTRDALVPQESTYELYDALMKQGIATKLIKVPNANHIFDELDGNIGNQAYLDLTMKWFSQYME